MRKTKGKLEVCISLVIVLVIVIPRSSCQVVCEELIYLMPLKTNVAPIFKK